MLQDLPGVAKAYASLNKHKLYIGHQQVDQRRFKQAAKTPNVHKTWIKIKERKSQRLAQQRRENECKKGAPPERLELSTS
jgi:hypothetical protein